MKPLRRALDRAAPVFAKGGKLEKMHPLYEALDTFLYTPNETTSGQTHVRDALDLKRMMLTVIVALIPCILMAMYNTGLQANMALQTLGAPMTEGWRTNAIRWSGIGFDPGSIMANFAHGALYFIPVYLVTSVAGGLCEVVFATIRKHEVNEGFLVTGMLFPLILPPTIPLWQVAIGIAFGVVIGKEIFGGTGKNFLNPALTARAFLYFAYPAQITGDAVWTAVDGYTGATPLGLAAIEGMRPVLDQVTWMQAFVGTLPGSMGETSTLACLFGAAVLIVTGVGSWRIMLACVIGTVATWAPLFYMGSVTNPMFGMPLHWHFVLGGMAFGYVFMATDPVSAAMTNAGKWIYGILVGFLTIVIRVINPAFPEGVMLAILFGNVFAPTIDYYVVKANVSRRKLRHA